MSTGIERKILQPSGSTPASTSDSTEDGDAFMRRVVPLLKEYTDKLQQYIVAANDLREVSMSNVDQGDEESVYLHQRWWSIRNSVTHLQAPIHELDRRVSQMIEHGHVESEIDRIELKLRLNELESALANADRVANCPLRRK